MERNADRPGEDLFLDGEELKLFRVYIRGEDDSTIMLEVIRLLHVQRDRSTIMWRASQFNCWDAECRLSTRFSNLSYTRTPTVLFLLLSLLPCQI